MNSQLVHRETFSCHVGLWIKEQRKKHNLSQEKLGDEMRVHRNSVSRWERGRNGVRCDMLLVEFATMCEVFGCDPGEAIGMIVKGLKQNVGS